MSSTSDKEPIKKTKSGKSSPRAKSRKLVSGAEITSFPKTKVSNTAGATDSLPLFIANNSVFFPNVITSVFVEDEVSLRAFQEAVNKDGLMLVVAAKPTDNGATDTDNGYYEVGTLVEILQFMVFPETAKVTIKGLERVMITSVTSHSSSSSSKSTTSGKANKKSVEHWRAKYSVLASSGKYGEQALKELRNTTFELLDKYVAGSGHGKSITPVIAKSLVKLENPTFIVDNIVAHLGVNLEAKQKVLEEADLLKRIALVNSLLEIEISLVDVEKRLRAEVKKQIEKNQKDYFLNEQLKAIHREMSKDEEGYEEAELLNKKIRALKAPKEVKDRLLQEAKKLQAMSSMNAEAGIIRGYLEVVTSLPWGIEPQIKINLDKAQKLLDSEHYGLAKVKERILEHLAVLHKAKNKSPKGPILCLIGSPGVGKTSLASSIAKASGRKFGRISLGGLKDESEIRGHRRTYIGAMPGKIIQLMRKLKVNNPLILLDEVDKISSDFRGDPAAALLEVLDPEQNCTFVDNYVEFEYDLSKVMFVATANSYNMHEALLDRMEVIELSGYTEEEKLAIAKSYLLPKNMEECSLTAKELEFDYDVLTQLIRSYTRESGVRQLNQQIANLTRKAVKELLVEKKPSVHITSENLVNYAGPAKFSSTLKEQEDRVGVVTGLAWTRTGGDTLYIESVKIPGKGRLKITGKLGDVMKESIQAAYSLIYSNCELFDLKPEAFKDHDVHIHVPEGAIPKDGPSAGIAMVTALVSLLSGKKVRSDLAMTGEITLRGKVLPIGGVKEKLLAALRFGIKEAVIPIGNEKDLMELPKIVTDNVKITLAEDISEVLKTALVD